MEKEFLFLNFVSRYKKIILKCSIAIIAVLFFAIIFFSLDSPIKDSTTGLNYESLYDEVDMDIQLTLIRTAEYHGRFSAFDILFGLVKDLYQTNSNNDVLGVIDIYEEYSELMTSVPNKEENIIVPKGASYVSLDINNFEGSYIFIWTDKYHTRLTGRKYLKTYYLYEQNSCIIAVIIEKSDSCVELTLCTYSILEKDSG